MLLQIKQISNLIKYSLIWNNEENASRRKRITKRGKKTDLYLIECAYHKKQNWKNINSTVFPFSKWLLYGNPFLLL